MSEAQSDVFDGDRKSAQRTADSEQSPTCMRCGYEVLPLPSGCKNPCPNCGFIYPLGDCDD